jgi:hypothetical protein
MDLMSLELWGSSSTTMILSDIGVTSATGSFPAPSGFEDLLH